MDAIERANEQLKQKLTVKRDPEIDAALTRARIQIEALAQTADELQAALPESVGFAVREGIRAEAAPVARQLAEVRGLMNRVIGRLEHLEGDLLTERNARVDDLSVLVELISEGWKSVDVRLQRIEETVSTGLIRRVA
jgi:hypothetical protein